jgi:plastocyanin
MRLLVRLAAVSFAIGGVVAAACSSDPTRPATDPDCVIPDDGDFRDSVQGRVVITSFQFVRDPVRVRQGMAVRWINCEPRGVTPHSSTSDQPGLWDSGTLQSGQQFLRVFNETGTFLYHCTPHPEMVARVIVE